MMSKITFTFVYLILSFEVNADLLSQELSQSPIHLEQDSIQILYQRSDLPVSSWTFVAEYFTESLDHDIIITKSRRFKRPSGWPPYWNDENIMSGARNTWFIGHYENDAADHSFLFIPHNFNNYSKEIFANTDIAKFFFGRWEGRGPLALNISTDQKTILYLGYNLYSMYRSFGKEGTPLEFYDICSISPVDPFDPHPYVVFAIKYRQNEK